jgi:hypothetical protein
MMGDKFIVCLADAAISTGRHSMDNGNINNVSYIHYDYSSSPKYALLKNNNKDK